MPSRNYTIFATPIGPCGIAWSERGVAGVQLPEATESGTRARIQRRFPDAREAQAGAIPAGVQLALDGIVALLNGSKRDLSAVTLDLSGVPDYHMRVYAVARTIPPGATITYGEIAARLGDPLAARAVGHALGWNPFPIIVPCHRVLAAGGRPGGFSASGGTVTKLRILGIEGAPGIASQLAFDLSR